MRHVILRATHRATHFSKDRVDEVCSTEGLDALAAASRAAADAAAEAAAEAAAAADAG